MVKQLAVATGSITFSRKGEKGDAGDSPSITKTTQYYAITSNLSTPSSWSTTMPNISANNNKGKFLWVKTVDTWSNGKTSESIIYTYIGKDGNDGTSVTIKGSLKSKDNLPTSGATLGDAYIIDKDMWVYTGTSTSDSTHYRGFQDVGQFVGKDGISATQYYTHIAWMKDSKGTGFTTSNPNGASYPYVGICVDTSSSDPTDYTKYDWTYIKGEQGNRGYGVKSTTTTYQIGNSGTTPPTGTWSTSVPNITDANPYLWTRTVITFENGTTNTSYSVATRGAKGALIRQHRGFESGSYKYLSGSGAEEYVDMVCIKTSSGNNAWYRCISTYTASSPAVTDKDSGGNARWELANNYKCVATDVLLAQNGSIDMLGTNQINLYNPTTGTMYGSFRVVSNDDSYALWIGGASGENAPFAVTRGGKLKATNGSFAGTIDATSGSIGGFRISSTALGTDGSMYLTKELIHFGDVRGITYDNGYYVTLGKHNKEGLEILSVTGTNSDISTGARINITANSQVSDPVSGGSMCTALDISSAWASEAGDFTQNDPYQGCHAIVIRGGDVIGLRPSIVRISTETTLTEFHHTVVCTNTSTITLYLPSSPKQGQCYEIVQRNGGRVNIYSQDSKNIHCLYNNKDYGSTWYSGTTGQVSWLWYDGVEWHVTFLCR